MDKKTAKKGKPFRKMSQKIIEKGRNWTAPETGAFCEILVDQVFNFAETLETKALKKIRI